MDFSLLDICSMTKIERNTHNVKNEIYTDGKFYYKLMAPYGPNNRTPLAYYTLENLNFIWRGDSQLQAGAVGLINEHTVPAFHRYLYQDNVCVGYVTKKGIPMGELEVSDALKFKYLKYISLMVNHSVEVGWGYAALDPSNIVEYDGRLSFIDLDFSPIKLSIDNLNGKEMLMWKNEFRSADGVYLNLLMKKLGVE